MRYDLEHLWRPLLLLCVLVTAPWPGAWGEPTRPLRPFAQIPTRHPLVASSQPPGQTANLSEIFLRNNQLSVDVRDQDLHAILRDIASQGDIEVRRLEELPKKRISMRFAAIPLVNGLQRLFRAAEISSYVLVTEKEGDGVRVQRILFFAANQGVGNARTRPRVARRPPPSPSPSPQRENQGEDQEESDTEESEATSVFEELKTNTAARRLLSQLVHPNEQVRERALERLIRLVSDDEKQAELLEFLEPLMEDLAAEDRTEREEARQEIRKLLRR